jgi:hypothetical protein
MKIHLSILLAAFIMLQPASYAGDAPAVTGSAYITRGSGDSIILRDLELFICKPSVVTLWEATYKGSRTRLQLLNGLVEFEQELPKHVVATARTDIDGKFKVTALPAGDYAVFADFSTSSATVCWLIPIKVQPDTPVELTLSNSTAKEIKNDR